MVGVGLCHTQGDVALSLVPRSPSPNTVYLVQSLQDLNPYRIRPILKEYCKIGPTLDIPKR